MEASLTHEEFSKNANTKFQVQADENTHVELDLIEVSELKIYPQQEEFTTLCFVVHRTCFSIRACATLSTIKWAEFELFIVPIKQDAEGFYYEADLQSRSRAVSANEQPSRYKRYASPGWSGRSTIFWLKFTAALEPKRWL